MKKEDSGLLRRVRHRVSALPFFERRGVIIIFLICIAFLGLILRLGDLQIVRSQALSSAASDFRTQSYVIHGVRGDILDSSGAVLATTLERYNVGVNQVKIQSYVDEEVVEENGTKKKKINGVGAAAAAVKLAPLLCEAEEDKNKCVDESELAGLLFGGEKKSSFVYVKKDISPDLWRKISALGIPGIEPEQYMKRVYPNGSVAGNIVGYTRDVSEKGENPLLKGQSGVEASYNDVLSGKDGRITTEVLGNGAILPGSTTSIEEGERGSSVKLTIDRDLENSLMDAVDDAVEKHNAQWGSAVVVEVGTGRVLALVDSSSPDPAHLEDTSSENWGSRAVQAPVEPGSVGKLITFSAALEKNLITPTSLFTVPDTIKMSNGQVFHDSSSHATEEMTAAGIMAKSYNTGLVQIGDKLTDEERYSYITSFGIGTKTGIELPAEEDGILYNYTQWDGRSRYTTMFGQGWAATTVQLGQYISIIANNGVKVPIHLVDSVVDSEGNEEMKVVGESQRIISSQTSQTMLQMMQGVTQKGSTGERAKIEGYNIAGKTGTAQVPDENGQLTKRVSTFVGVLPAEKPQVAIAVVVYGASGTAYGGDVAAPVFKDVGTFVVQQLGIAPSTQELYKYPWTKSEMNGTEE